MLADLPHPRQIIAEANAWAATLTYIGDQIKDWEPEDSRIAQFARENAQLIEYATGGIRGLGGAKAEAVMLAVRSAWGALGKADDLFDTWWERKGRRVLTDYVAFANTMNGWKVP
jgi:hypothetical protein